MQNPNMQWTRSHHNWVVTRTVGTVMVVTRSGGNRQSVKFAGVNGPEQDPRSGG